MQSGTVQYVLAQSPTHLHTQTTNTQASYTHLRSRSISVWWESVFIKTYMTSVHKKNMSFIFPCFVFSTKSLEKTDPIFYLCLMKWTRWMCLGHVECNKTHSGGSPGGAALFNLNDIYLYMEVLLSRRVPVIFYFKFMPAHIVYSICSWGPIKAAVHWILDILVQRLPINANEKGKCNYFVYLEQK